MRVNRVLGRRRAAWDEAAGQNPMYYIASERKDWETTEFFRSGEIVVAQWVDPFLARVGLEPRSVDAVEIGCGIGRLSVPLANRFRQVVGVDLSPKMIEAATRLHSGTTNLRFVANSGNDLPTVADHSCGFAFSALVFQHIPSFKAIEGYVAEIGRVLTSGGYFVIQANSPTVSGFFRLFHDRLVGTPFWNFLGGLMAGRAGGDATVWRAFAGVYLTPNRFGRMCAANGMQLLETVTDPDPHPPGSYWAYGKRL
jgi:SAM-dependent methyltransferase